MFNFGIPLYIVVLQLTALVNSRICSTPNESEEDIAGQHVRRNRDKWPDGIVKYHLDASLSNSDIATVYAAFEEYHTKTCIRFEPKNETDVNYVSIELDPKTCGLAETCMRGGYQYIKIGNKYESCRSKSTIIHELGHSLCLIHEHQRADRDNYVAVSSHSDCPESDMKKHNSTKYMDHGFYDYSSQMHYSCGDCVGSKDEFIKGCGDQVTEGLSVLDVDYINELYNCSGCKRHRWLPHKERREGFYQSINSVNFFENGAYITIFPCRTIFHGQLVVGTFNETFCNVFVEGMEYNLKENFEVLYLPNVTQTKQDTYKWTRLNELTSREEVEEIFNYAITGGYMHTNESQYFTNHFIALGTIDNLNQNESLPTKYGHDVFGTVSRHLHKINAKFLVGKNEITLRDYNVLTCLPKSEIPGKVNKQCKCSDVHVKKSSCGRAYLEGGCRICDSMYLDLSKNSEGMRYFPEDFSTSIEAFRLREGCTLTIFTEDNFNGEATLFNQTVIEDFRGEVGSYECECNDDLYVPKAQPLGLTSFPAMLEIPTSIDQINRLLQDDHKQHVGLQAARMSYWNGRSSKNAYILVLGSAGAGKTSFVDLLLDLDKRGVIYCGSEVIKEYRIPVKIDEIGVANSELRIIDTPGIGDTRGLEQDAKYLATLENYLSTHEELKYRLPNVVLIFHKFNDNRFDHIQGNFIRMLRALDYFREKITDQQYSNVLFVMSHFMSVTKRTRLSPDGRIQQMKQVIQDYSQFPRPIPLVVAENRGNDQGLLMRNGFWKLPNGDYYPKNLLEKLDLITKACGDPIGQAIFLTAFRDTENLNVSQTDQPLLSSVTNRTHDFLNLLTNKPAHKVINTQISMRLQQMWVNQLNNEQKLKYPLTLVSLQKSLNLFQINNFEDVPTTPIKVLELLKAVRTDSTTRSLLENGLGIHAPVFLQSTLVGSGYHLFQDQPLTTSPFQLGEFQLSDIGFRFPSSFICKLEPGTENKYMVFVDKASYMGYRLQELGIDGNIPAKNFTNGVKPGYNIRPHWFSIPCSISATKDFRFFELVLTNEPKLTREFENALRKLTPVNISDFTSVSEWLQFFGTYGAQVVKSAYGGGSIQLKLKKPDQCSLRDIVRLAELVDDLTYNLQFARNDTMEYFAANDVQLSSTFIGGDPEYHTSNLVTMTLPEANILLQNWRKSLQLNPVMLATSVRLQPLSLAVKSLGQNYSEEIDKAVQLLFDFVPVSGKPTSEMRKMDREISAGKSEYNIFKTIKYNRQQVRDWIWPLKITEKEKRDVESEAAEIREHSRREREETIRKIEREERERMRYLQMREEIERMRYLQMREEIERMRYLQMGEEIEGKLREGGCLKAGTAILMADGTEKNVEMLKVGDFVMDKDMRPSKVMGVATEFLLGRKFYGFEENGPFFFTSNHLFVGPDRENVGGYSKLQFYAASPEVLYEDNPLMEQLNVQNMLDFGNVSLFYLKNGKTELGTFTLDNVYREGMEYPEDTLMYDIQVDSPTGTYFANGYVCRHEVPPLEYWPNTLSVLFRLLESPAFSDILENVPYNVDNLKKVHRMVDQMNIDLEYILESRKWEQADETVHVEMMTLDSGDLEQAVSQLYRHSISSATILRLYSRLGPVIAHWMDSDNQVAARKRAMLQDYLVKWTSAQLEQRLSILLS